MQGFTPRVGPETIREDVDPLYLFDLASRQARWASVRQATITGNIANANTPGYQAGGRAFLGRHEQDPSEHGDDGARAYGRALRGRRDFEDEGIGLVGSHRLRQLVNLDQEMLKAADVNRTYTLNTNIVRASTA